MYTNLVLQVMMMANLSATDLVQKQCLKPEQIYQQVRNAVVRVLVKSSDGEGHGSGLLVDAEGTAVTSAHVSNDMEEISVVDSGGEIYTYKESSSGDPMSVSVIKPTGKRPDSFIPLNSPVVQIGEPIYTLGYPLDYQEMFAAGVVASVIEAEGHKFIAVEMPTFPGMSGSAVFDCEGEVIGFVLATDRRGFTIGILNHYDDAKELLQ